MLCEDVEMCFDLAVAGLGTLCYPTLKCFIAGAGTVTVGPLRSPSREDKRLDRRFYFKRAWRRWKRHKKQVGSAEIFLNGGMGNNRMIPGEGFISLFR